MAITTTVTSIGRQGGKVYVRFSDGIEYEFNSVADLKNSFLNLDSNPDLAKALILLWWLKRDADATTASNIEGKTVTFDLSNAQPLRVQ